MEDIVVHRFCTTTFYVDKGYLKYCCTSSDISYCKLIYDKEVYEIKNSKDKSHIIVTIKDLDKNCELYSYDSINDET